MNKMITFLLLCSFGLYYCPSKADPLKKLEEFSVKKLPPPISISTKNNGNPEPERILVKDEPKKEQEKEVLLKKLEEFSVKKLPPPISISTKNNVNPEPERTLVYDVPSEQLKDEPKKEQEKEVLSLYFRYPIQFTPESLSSFGYIFNSGKNNLFGKIQLFHGQYKFLSKGKDYPLLILKPRLSAGFAISVDSMKFWGETYNQFKIKNGYGAGFKVIAEGHSFHFAGSSLNGYLQAFIYKNFPSTSKWLSVYGGYTSANLSIDLKKEAKEYLSEAKKLLLEKEGLVIGIYFNPNIEKTLSFSVETNAQNHASFSIYYGLK